MAEWLVLGKDILMQYLKNNYKELGYTFLTMACGSWFLEKG